MDQLEFGREGRTLWRNRKRRLANAELRWKINKLASDKFVKIVFQNSQKIEKTL